MINRARELGLTVVVDLQGRHGESLRQLARQQHIGWALDYREEAGEPVISLWQAGSAAAGDSWGECSAGVAAQQLQRLAMAKAARGGG